jgi:hypothetical protein
MIIDARRGCNHRNQKEFPFISITWISGRPRRPFARSIITVVMAFERK